MTHFSFSRLTKPILVTCLACATAASATAQSINEAFELLCDRTLHYYDDAIGNQIEFTNADGVAFLWYPGRETIIEGIWSVNASDAGAVQICFEYPPGTFETSQSGIYCYDYGSWVVDIVEDGIRDGDPYALSSGAVPFVVPRFPRIPIEALKELAPDTTRGPGCTAFVS